MSMAELRCKVVKLLKLTEQAGVALVAFIETDNQTPRPRALQAHDFDS